MTAGTEPSKTLRVVVADDHPLFRDGLVAALAMIDGVEVVGTAADGEQAIALTRELAPDVVLMDLAMPGVNGIEATRAIVQTHPGTAVLVLTMAGTDDSLIAALRAGARGYLLKEAGRQEISHALRSVAAGQAVFGTSVADRILNRLTEPPRGKPGTSTAFPQLTEREVEILDLLARGLSNHAISARLYLSDKTVRNHVSNILAKTGAPNRHAAADMARQEGLGGQPSSLTARFVRLRPDRRPQPRRSRHRRIRAVRQATGSGDYRRSSVCAARVLGDGTVPQLLMQCQATALEGAQGGTDVCPPKRARASGYASRFRAVRRARARVRHSGWQPRSGRAEAGHLPCTRRRGSGARAVSGAIRPPISPQHPAGTAAR
jgi:DNA-binding NarL/FixJ family response regulator